MAGLKWKSTYVAHIRVVTVGTMNMNMKVYLLHSHTIDTFLQKKTHICERHYNILAYRVMTIKLDAIS